MPPITNEYKKNQIRALYVIMLMLQITWIVLFSYFIHYFNKLKQDECSCALSWRINFMMGLLAGMVVLIVAKLFLRGKFIRWAALLQGVFAIAFTLIAFQFSKTVRDDQCQCALTPAFRILDIVNMLMVFTLVLTVLNTALVVGFNFKSSK